MAIPVQSNFELRSKLPPFTIQQFKTIREMKLYPEYDIPEGITTYCLEDEKEYQWKSSNPDSPTTGKWKVKSSTGGKEEVYIGTDEPTDSDVVLWVDTDEPSGGGEGTTDYSDLENKPSINDVELFGNKTTQDLNLISDDEDNIIEIGSDGKLYATSSDGTIDYSELENKPSINDVELDGNKTLADLDLISTDVGNGLKLGSDGKLLSKGGDGILAEGNVRGVRTYTTSQTLGSGWTNAKMAYLDGDESMFDATTNEFVAPVDGLYLISYRPLNTGLTKQALVQIIHAEKSSSSDANIAFSHNPGNLNSSVQPMATGITKLKAGQRVMCRVYYASMTITENKDVPCEFYLISERTDGLVAEAKYANQTFAKGANQSVEFTEETDTNVFPGGGQIVLPEDGSYLFTADWCNGVNTVTSHVITTYLYKDSSSGPILDYRTFSGIATAATCAVTHVLKGKKGDKFVLITRHDSYAYTYVRKPIDEYSGVKLFKMSLSSGSGGGSGTTDYEDLQNKPTINDTELSGDLTTENLGIISEDDNNSIALGKDGNLFVDNKSEDIERIEAKADRINIAQKTINEVGRKSLLDSQDLKITLTKASSSGTGAYTAVDRDIILNDSIENYDQILLVAKCGSSDYISSFSNILAEKDLIVYNNTNTRVNNDGSLINISLTAPVSASSAFGGSHYGAEFWFKDNKTLRFYRCITSQTNAAYVQILDIIGVKNKSITIDPVEYVNDTSGIEDTPVGHILPYTGKFAPKHYLLCNGAEYNISDYRYLAQFIKDEYGSFNKFGGDGVNTFAVPKYNIQEPKTVKVSPIMTGNSSPSPYNVTASDSYNTATPPYKAFDGNKSLSTETNGWLSAANSQTPWLTIDLGTQTKVNMLTYYTRVDGIGKCPSIFRFQGSSDGVNFITLETYNDVETFPQDKTTGRIDFELPATYNYRYYRIQVDKIYAPSGSYYLALYEVELYYKEASVISCIKYEPTYFMELNQDAYMGLYYDDYSTEERVVGKWVDGKPIYRRVVSITPTSKSFTYKLEGANVDTPIRCYGLSDSTEDKVTITLRNVSASQYDMGVWLNESGSIRLELGSGQSLRKFIIVSEYTKTTDAPNSFDVSMIFDQYSTEQLIELPVTDEEINECLKGV